MPERSGFSPVPASKIHIMRPLFLALAVISAVSAQASVPSQIASDNNAFAFDLFHQLPKGKNTFFSPASISAALSMTYAGAHTTTASEMEKVLHINSPETYHTDMGQWIKHINQQNGTDIKISVANRLFGAKRFVFLETYLEKLKTLYQAPLEKLDFAGKTEESRLHINQWVENQTNHKIKNLLAQGVIDSSTKLVLVNAIYFYGDWASQFDEKSTRTGAFYFSDEKSTDTKLMHQQAHFAYADGSGFKAIRVPYKGHQFSMEIYLPDQKNGLAEWEKNLTVEKYNEWSKHFKSYEVSFTLPKFKMNAAFSLGDILKQMGMKTAFARDADFSGMTGKRELYISAVVHKAFIDVGEKGTEAAAATAVVMQATSTRMEEHEEIKIFTVDHPFFFLIRENNTGSILFMGRMMEPEKV
jgi:serpin B